MSKAPRIEGFYFTLAVRLFNNDWSPAKRAVAIGLCRLCAETNGSGVIKLHVSDLIDAITSFTFDGKPPRKSAVLKEIDSLSSGAFLQKLSGNYVFVREFWGLNHAPGNDNHWNPIVRSVDSMPLEARSAWHAYYDPIRDAALDAIANRKRKGIKDAIADQQDQEQDQEQDHKHIKPPIAPQPGGHGAVAPVLTLADLEAKLPQTALGAWADLKQAMQTHRKAKMRDSVPIKLLTELLESITKHSLTPAQVEAGIRACWRCSPPADNERYFRKAALGHRDSTPIFPGSSGPSQYASQRSGNGRVMPSGNYVSDPIPGDEPEVQV